MRHEHADVDAEDGDDDAEESDRGEHADKLDAEEDPDGHHREEDRAVQTVVVEVDHRVARVEDGKHRRYVVLQGQFWVSMGVVRVVRVVHVVRVVCVVCVWCV